MTVLRCIADLRALPRVAVAVLALASPSALPAHAELMVVGIDTKFWFDDAGNRVFKPNTGDLVAFYDLADHAHPKPIGSLPLENSVVGPPTNLALTPNDRLALIANSLHTVQGPDGVWKAVPADEVFVVDTAARPPRLVGTVSVGKQPSGIAIRPDGRMALVANRADKTISVLAIDGQSVRVTGTVAVGDVVTSVAFTPDGRQALASLFTAHKIILLDVTGETVHPAGRDMLVGQYPYAVTVTGDGRFGLAGADGELATSHGDTNPVAVIDLQARPPRVTGFVPVGDGIEGIVASPGGALALASVLQGSLDAPKGSWYRHDVGRVVLLRADGRGLSVASSADVGAFPEGVAFSHDGSWAYAGNFGSNSLSVLKIVNGRLVKGGENIKLPGPPAALRVGSQ